MTPDHSTQTATPPADSLFKALETSIGFVPNVFAVMGAAPNVLAAFVSVNTHLAAGTLTATEREIIHLAVSVENDCSYCVAGHTAFAHNARMKPADLKALRAQAPLTDSKHQALRHFAEVLVQGRGKGCDAALAAFLAAGYTRDQALEVVLGVCNKTFSNLTANLLQIPLDDQFARFRWQKFAQPRTAVGA